MCWEGDRSGSPNRLLKGSGDNSLYYLWFSFFHEGVRGPRKWGCWGGNSRGWCGEGGERPWRRKFRKHFDHEQKEPGYDIENWGQVALLHMNLLSKNDSSLLYRASAVRIHFQDSSLTWLASWCWLSTGCSTGAVVWELQFFSTWASHVELLECPHCHGDWFPRVNGPRVRN